MNEIDPLGAFEDSTPAARWVSLAVLAAYGVIAFWFLPVWRAIRIVLDAILAAALVWFPSMLEPIRSHRTWGVRIHQGALTEATGLLGWIALGVVGIALLMDVVWLPW